MIDTRRDDMYTSVSSHLSTGPGENAKPNPLHVRARRRIQLIVRHLTTGSVCATVAP